MKHYGAIPEPQILQPEISSPGLNNSKELVAQIDLTTTLWDEPKEPFEFVAAINERTGNVESFTRLRNK